MHLDGVPEKEDQSSETEGHTDVNQEEEEETDHSEREAQYLGAFEESQAYQSKETTSAQLTEDSSYDGLIDPELL